MKTKKLKYCLLTLSILLPINTLALNKTETIYTNLKYDGTVEQSVVSNHLSFIGEGDVKDQTELKDILNINGDETFKLDGNRLTWNNKGNDIFYQGKTTKSMPIEVEISYFLDGKKEELKNIIGKEGHITIEYSFKNNQNNKVNINGKTETIYTPFTTTVGTIIKGKDTKNISIDNGKIMSTGSRDIVLGIASPGLYDSTKIDEFKSLNKVTIEFDTSSFELGTTYIVSTPKLLDNKDITIFKKVDSLENSVKQLKTNMALLENGAKELANGAKELKTGSDTLTGSLAQILSSVGELKTGSITLNRGLKQVNEALANAKLEISGQASIDELTTLKNANTRTINTLISSTGKTLEELSTIYTSNNLSVYNGVDPDLLAIKNTYELVGLLNNNNKAIDASIQNANTMLIKIDEMSKTVTDSLLALETGSEKVATGMSQLEVGVQKIYTGSKELNIGSKRLSEGSSTLSQGTSTFKTEGIDKLSSYANSLKTYSDRIEALVNLSQKYNGFTSSNSNETIFVNLIKSYK